MSISATTPGGWEGACTEAAKDENWVQARHVPDPGSLA